MAYLTMARMGRLVTSLITLYQPRIFRHGLVSFAFSQSGRSPDLALPQRFDAAGGSTPAAILRGSSWRGGRAVNGSRL